MEKTRTKIPKRYFILIPLYAVLLVGVFLFIRTRGIGFREIVEYTPANHLLAAIFIIALYTVRVIFWVFPMAIVHVASGLIFPLPWGIVVSYAGMLLEMLAGYFWGRRLGRERVAAMLEKYEKARDFLDTLKGQGPAVCVITRLLPLPYDITSMFFGASGVPLGGYLVFSLLGASPGMIPYVIAGGTLGDPLSKEFLIPLSISIAIAAGSLIVFRRIQKKRRP